MRWASSELPSTRSVLVLCSVAQTGRNCIPTAQDNIPVPITMQKGGAWGIQRRCRREREPDSAPGCGPCCLAVRRDHGEPQAGWRGQTQVQGTLPLTTSRLLPHTLQCVGGARRKRDPMREAVPSGFCQVGCCLQAGVGVTPSCTPAPSVLLQKPLGRQESKGDAIKGTTLNHI